jgi:hypothetical protein
MNSGLQFKFYLHLFDIIKRFKSLKLSRNMFLGAFTTGGHSRRALLRSIIFGALLRNLHQTTTLPPPPEGPMCIWTPFQCCPLCHLRIHVIVLNMCGQSRFYNDIVFDYTVASVLLTLPAFSATLLDSYPQTCITNREL